MAALLGMVVLVALVLALVWRVYLHHQRMIAPDEPTVVQFLRPGTAKLL